MIGTAEDALMSSSAKTGVAFGIAAGGLFRLPNTSLPKNTELPAFRFCRAIKAEPERIHQFHDRGEAGIADLASFDLRNEGIANATGLFEIA